MQITLVTMSRPGADATVGLVYATITGRADKWFFLSSPDLSLVRALRAAVARSNRKAATPSWYPRAWGQASYVLAVLTRATPAQATLKLPGDVAMHTAQGQLRVQAEQARTERAPAGGGGRRASRSGRRARRRMLPADSTHRRSRSTRASALVSSIAQNITSTVGPLVQKTRDSFRWTENLEETRAGRVRLQIKERFHLKAKHATVLAEGQVKIDGEKIDLG